MLHPNYGKRDYLLPKGCKDLIDVIRMEESKKPNPPLLLPPTWRQPVVLMGDLFFSDATLVTDLAAFLGKKPFQIIADLLELRVYVTIKQAVNFETVSKVAWKYGYTARKLA